VLAVEFAGDVRGGEFNQYFISAKVRRRRVAEAERKVFAVGRLAVVDIREQQAWK
jgi:hypothetical protein